MVSHFRKTFIIICIPGYCAFHAGDYKRALLEYEAMLSSKKVPKNVHICLACTYFYLGMYQDAEKVSIKNDTAAGHRV